MITQELPQTFSRRLVVTTWDRSTPQQKRSEIYYDERGLLHRDSDEGPAKTVWWPSGNVAEIVYCWHGLRHRDGSPALVWYEDRKEDGKNVPSHERWYRYGRRHRDAREGAAVTDWDGLNCPVSKFYYIHGYSFRDPRDGPESADFRLGREDCCTWEAYSEHIPPRPRPPISWLRQKYGRYREDLGRC
jgi:hypothetical protein